MFDRKFSSKDIEILGARPLYRGFFTMVEYQFRHRLFAGGWSETVTREVFERGHAVVVLPYDPVSDSVVLIEQLRLPALETSASPWLLELVAGMVEEGETIETVARRELLEEAGLEAKRLLSMGSYLSSPGGCSERFYFMLAEVDASAAAGLHGLAHEHEDIRVHVMSRAQAYALVEAGGIDNGASVIGLQWLQLNHGKLRADDAGEALR